MKISNRLFVLAIILVTTLTLLGLVAVPVVKAPNGPKWSADVSAELSLCLPPDPCANVRFQATLEGPAADALAGTMKIQFAPPGPPDFEPPDPCFASVTGTIFHTPGPTNMPSVTFTGTFHGPGQSGKACTANLQGVTVTVVANSADGTITITRGTGTCDPADSSCPTLASGKGIVAIVPQPPPD